MLAVPCFPEVWKTLMTIELIAELPEEEQTAEG